MRTFQNAGGQYCREYQQEVTVGEKTEQLFGTACREAEAILLDRRYLMLSEEAFGRFTEMLDTPPAENPKLRRLLETRPPWVR